MSDLGMLLRKARLERKLSLDDLQETTKIRKAYLEAIEDGNYKKLPGNFYVRAFIKSYSEAVGLDPNEVLRLYQNVIPAPEPETAAETVRQPRAAGRNTERLSKWASNVMMISFVVLILGIIYYYVNANYEGNTNGEPAGGVKRVTDKTEQPTATASDAGSTVALSEPKRTPVPPATATVPTPPKMEVKLTSSERGTDFYTVTNTDKLKIDMKITGDACWIEIDSVTTKKEMVEQGTFTTGKTKSWELANSAYLIVGKSNAIEITVNGVPIAVGDTPNPKRIQIDLQT